ncbi:MAG: hypothetical protein OXQ32_01735 [bacterium]|nr:hypothetical protein [bacterium]MDE2876870.1 hypothetical protein [Gemmatimonadota bacterium]
MNVARRLRTRIPLVAMVVLALGALAMTGRVMAQEGGDDDGTTGPYWFDYPTCRCFKLKPIVVVVDKK